MSDDTTTHTDHFIDSRFGFIKTDAGWVATVSNGYGPKVVTKQFVATGDVATSLLAVLTALYEQAFPDLTATTTTPAAPDDATESDATTPATGS